MTEATENKKTGEMPKLKIKDYLPYFRRGKQSTKLRNARKLKKFCEWAKKTPDELIAEYKEAKDACNKP